MPDFANRVGENIRAEYGTMPNKLSTNSYVDVDLWGVGHLRTKIFRFSATTNNLLVSVLGSYDGINYTETVEADISVTTATPVTKTYTNPYAALKVQVKAASAGSQGTLATKVFGSWI